MWQYGNLISHKQWGNQVHNLHHITFRSQPQWSANTKLWRTKAIVDVKEIFSKFNVNNLENRFGLRVQGTIKHSLGIFPKPVYGKSWFKKHTSSKKYIPLRKPERRSYIFRTWKTYTRKKVDELLNKQQISLYNYFAFRLSFGDSWGLLALGPDQTSRLLA